MLECRPGQRWISNTEPELGLGIVCEVADRRVVVEFPAGAERRTYALDNAPLTRVRYRVAERVRSQAGLEITVAEHHLHEGCIIYRGLDAQGGAAEMHETELDSFVQFNRPLDRLFVGHIDRVQRFRLRAQTLEHQHRHRRSPAHGLLGPRVLLLAHQFYIADEVSRRHAPRVLLADEVGLGKTIEAGLVVHRQLFEGRVERVLVVVPDHLVHQWLVEMLRRFNLHFSILDHDMLEQLEVSAAVNPFTSSQLALVPSSVLVGDPRRLEQACAAGWDLLVVDEAHHLAWTPEGGASPAYAAIAALGAQVPGLLLLTATPEQLGVSGHFARLALLDPHRYAALEDFLDEERRYGTVSRLVGALLDGEVEPDAALLSEVEGYLGAARMAALGSGNTADLNLRLVRELLDHHGTGRVLFRNSRDHIAGFPQRRLHSYPLDCPPAWRTRLAALPPAAQLTPERGAGADWVSADPRAAWLYEWLREYRSEKSLVICADAGTAQDLEAWLTTRKGVRAAVFHEGLDLVQRDRAAAYFADADDCAQALICSEIGSEGRNFQFAHHLVLFDLPLNPDLLEQRIGRLDRIGQRHTVEIHVPYLEHSAQDVLHAWLHEGLDAFEHVSAAGATLFAEFSDRLLACMADPEALSAREALIADTAARHAALAALLKAGRDRLLELNSFDPARAARIVAEVEAAARTAELRTYMDAVFDAFGIEAEEHGASSLVLQPGDHMACENFPGLPDGGLTVTFDRAQALARDDFQFLTWEHPMVTGAMDMVLGAEFGNASFGVVKAAGLTPGALLVECLFAMVCPAPRALGIARYLPRSGLRVVLDGAGTEVGAARTAHWLDTAVRDAPVATAHKVVTRLHDQIEQLVDRAAQLGAEQQAPMIDDALAAMNTAFTGEIERLRQLARVNPNVREQEIALLETQQAATARHLARAQLKLDAVRVVIAT